MDFFEEKNYVGVRGFKTKKTKKPLQKWTF